MTDADRQGEPKPFDKLLEYFRTHTLDEIAKEVEAYPKTCPRCDKVLTGAEAASVHTCCVTKEQP